MTYEAVIMDIGNEEIHQTTGTSVMAVLMETIEASCEDVYQEQGMSLDELNSGYRFALTTDHKLEKLMKFEKAAEKLAGGDVDLLVIVGWDRLTAPIGFVRRIK